MTMTNRRTFMRGAGALAATLPLARYARASTEDAWQRAADIARNVRPPTFPNRWFVTTGFGADPEGKKLSTTAINQAIDKCSAEGGGRVVVPRGTYLTGAIHLKSGVDLHIAEGATLKFDTNPSSYPIVFTRWEGMELMNYSPLIYARRQKNIAITGKGTLDGQGSEQHWWSWKGKWGGTTKYGW